jgi:hypothetical protein
MTDAAPPEAPGGLALAEFKSVSLDVGDWLWGMVRGSFNEKQSVSQMIVDAVIGMIPVVGDVTAARDLIAIVIGLCDDPRKREDKFQWMLLAVMIFALIPVLGGVIKGVGRILIHSMGEVARIMDKGARTARLLEAAREMVAAANRLGVGNAEKWLKELNFARYQNAAMEHINGLLVRIHNILSTVESKAGRLLPSSLKERLTSLKDGLMKIKAIVADHIPASIKQLDSDLRELQAFIHSGGETTSKAVSHTAQAGAKNLSYTEELILLEGKGATRSARGGLAQNSSKANKIEQWYKHEPGFPDLTSRGRRLPGSLNADFPLIATYAGQIVNREVQAGERIFRVFGPKGKTHGVDVLDAFSGGSPARLGGPSFWGLGEVPTTAERWRQGSAVLDEWNRDGFMVVGQVLPGRPAPLRGCTGVIAEQQGDKIGVQYLRGGDKQAILEIPADVAKALNQLGEDVQKTGKAIKAEIGGISWDIRPTGWQDVNGIHGYFHMPGPGTIQTVRLGAREIASKRDQGGSN